MLSPGMVSLRNDMLRSSCGLLTSCQNLRHTSGSARCLQERAGGWRGGLAGVAAAGHCCHKASTRTHLSSSSLRQPKTESRTSSGSAARLNAAGEAAILLPIKKTDRGAP